MLSSLCQVLLTLVPPTDAPMRFGLPLPRDAIARGLRLRPSGVRLQWSVLQAHPGEGTGPLWVEVAVSGHRSGQRLRLTSDGVATPSAAGGSGAVVERSHDEAEGIRTWRWRAADGALLCRDRILRRPRSPGDAADAAVGGTWQTEWQGSVLDRCVAERCGAAWWRRAFDGCAQLAPLPRRDRGMAVELRAALVASWRSMPMAPGAEGRGDYLRLGDDGEPRVTNLEYDTTLGLLRLALHQGDREALRRAHAAATHLIDQDIDVSSGLPFRHGRGHRTARPETGHCWIRGLLWTGCVFADRVMIDAALEIARSLARRVLSGRESVEFGRDLGTPLLELEAALAFSDEAGLLQACDALADGLLGRWDDALGVFRFPEGETAKGRVYRDPAWQTAGCVVPGLRAHVARTGSSRVQRVLERIEQRLLSLLRSGQPGIVSSYAVGLRRGEVFGVARQEASPTSVLLLEGLSARGRARVLRRRSVRRALEQSLDASSDRLATEWSMLARCAWVWQ